MHVLNNFLAFGLALAFGDLTSALNADGGSSWWMILSTLTQSLVYLGARDVGGPGDGPGEHRAAGRGSAAARRRGTPFWPCRPRACNVRDRFWKGRVVVGHDRTRSI